jgi:extracellular elastinolytic metalloproteinase
VIRGLGVVSPQTSGGTTFLFSSWSDGGQALHEISTPVADTTFTATYQAAGATIVFADGFGSDLGWATNPSGTDTAVSGRWERGDSQATSFNGMAMQLGACDGGTVNCMATGLVAGAAVGTNDVDGGVTTVRSPAITLPATGTLILSFASYFSHLDNSSADDFFRVGIVGTSRSAVLFQELGSPTNDPAAWVTRSFDITSFAGQTIRILFLAADNAGGSLVEAGVDTVTIVQR